MGRCVQRGSTSHVRRSHRCATVGAIAIVGQSRVNAHTGRTDVDSGGTIVGKGCQSACAADRRDR